MQINYNQLSENKKVLQFTDGCYPVEFNQKNKWVWTSNEFGGIVQNIKNVVLTLDSNIDNVLRYKNKEMTIIPNCLNIVSLDLESESDFILKLDEVFNAPGDNRLLGVKILSINVDGDIIF